MLALLSVAAATVALAAPAGGSSLHGPTSQVRIVQTANGPVIANDRGMTLYVYVNDLLTSAPSACTGDCRNDWPPALAKGRLTVAAGVTGRIGTVERFGEGRQLTMDGRPLYTFSGDTPGETRGNGIGNLWWAMTPTGLAATAFPAPRATYSGTGTATLTVVHTRYGPVVANRVGEVVYIYSDDTPTASACIWTSCALDWPPVTVTGTPSATSDITAPLAVIAGPEGVRQITLGGHPLYTFAGDLHPGDTHGQGIGSDWYLISPQGAPVTASEGM